MAEKKKYNSILISGRKDQTLTYTKYIKDEESGESVKESLDKKVNITDELTTQQIKDGAITNEKMAADSVGNTNLQDGSVSNEKLEDESITNEKLAENSITKDKLKDNTIGVEKLDPELRQTINAATGLPEDLVETIQNVDDTLKDHQSQLDDKQSQIDDKQQQITANDEDISLLQNRSTQMEETIKSIAATGGASQATAVTYNNENSSLTAVNAQAAIDEVDSKLSDLYKGHNKAAQLPFYFEHDYNGSDELIRTNNFSPCTVYGIILYAIQAGSVVLYSHNVKSNTFEELESVEIKNKGLNFIKLSNPFEITEEKKLGYLGDLIGIKKSSDNGALGMYEITALSSHDTSSFYKDFEANYGVITSLYLIDTLQKIETKANEVSSFIKTNNSLEEINTYFLADDRVRANNFSGTAKGIKIYAVNKGAATFGILNSDFSSTKLGEVYLKKGINYIYFDQDITCGTDRQIYIQPIDAKIGLTDSNGVGMWDSVDKQIFENWEIAYQLIQTVGVEEQLGNLKNEIDIKIETKANEVSSFIKTNNSLEEINTYFLADDRVRANNFSGTAKGIKIYAVNKGAATFGILNSDFSSTKLGEVYLKKGINYIYFDQDITCGTDRQIYIQPIDAKIGLTDSNGVGMWDSVDKQIFENWEIAYQLIQTVGVEEQLGNLKNEIDIKIETKANEVSSFIKTNNSLEEINTYFLADDRVRANNFSGTAKGIKIYAVNKGAATFGILNSDFSSTKLGEVYLKKGINYIFFDQDITCGTDRQIYIQPIDAKIGLTDSNGVGMWDSVDKQIFENWEIAYQLIQTVGVEEQLGNLKNEIDINIETKANKVSSFIKTNNSLEEINTYFLADDRVRANNFSGTAKGIKIYAVNKGAATFGILNSDFSSTKLGEVYLKKGINYIFFDQDITCGTDRQIYIQPIDAKIGLTDSNGVGMWDSVDKQIFENWEIAYQLIQTVGVEEQLGNLKNEIDIINDNLKESGLDINYGEIILPSKIHVATGTECNLWWSSIANVREGDKSIYFETVCDIGRNTERGFVIDTTDTISSNIGEHSLRIVSRRVTDRKIITDVNVTIIVSSNQNGSGNKTILMLGDSRFWASNGGTNGTDSSSNFIVGHSKTISTEVKKLIDNNQGANFTFVGHTVSPDDPLVRNCADSGATYGYPLQQFESVGGIINYVKANGSKNGNLDFVTIMYGINDLSDWKSNVIEQYENSVNRVEGIINNAKRLIDTILASYPNCKIILIIESTTCANQDGWGYWGGKDTNRQSMIEMEKAQKYLRKILISTFDNGKYNNNVILSSAGLWCDRLYSFPFIIGKVSQRCSAKTKEIFQDCVHPFDDGYKQISDGIFGTIKYLLEL